MKKKLASLTAMIVALVAWAVLFELAATYWVAKRGDPLDKAKQVLVSDRELGWRQKKNFNGEFLDIPLKTDDLGLRNSSFGGFSKTSKNIILLGPSSTFGWGVEESQVYSSLLWKILRDKYPGSNIHTLNAGQIGFSSWQGLRFFKAEKLNALKIDVLVIAYGVNDVDRFRFFYAGALPDKKEFEILKSVREIFLQNILLKSNFLNLLSRKASALFSNFKYFQREVPARRVSNIDFQENIEELVRLGRSRGAEVVLLTSAYQLPSFDRLDSKTEDLSERYFNIGKDKYQEKKYSEALVHFLKAAEMRPDQNEVYYYLSCCYSYLGDRGKRKEMFEKALRTEPKRIAHDIKEINMILRNIAQKNEIALVDIEAFFRLWGDGTMFLDPIHFSIKGHEKVAESLADKIEKHDLLKVSRREG